MRLNASLNLNANEETEGRANEKQPFIFVSFRLNGKSFNDDWPKKRFVFGNRIAMVVATVCCCYCCSTPLA